MLLGCSAALPAVPFEFERSGRLLVLPSWSGVPRVSVRSSVLHALTKQVVLIRER